ncbi:expressed unknown protein [Seminavis robusta]|uniref:BTB domain-containing protein n=1 Tax=Seminavis robusta TaxID=568900 RepID=A0A9N8HPA8_9STRA|nr:expressed unknown protein [Seminavis robusta]|eukprot:Sro1053_g235880.1 n/a (307) ;mRNA; r:21163-22083
MCAAITHPSSSHDMVVVVVGSKEFRVSRNQICSCSEFFGSAYHNGSDEAKAGRFVFSDSLNRPEEWELVMSLLRPFSRITEDNFATVLPWFSFLGIHQGTEECDKYLHAKLLSLPTTTELGVFLTNLHTCVRYDLNRSKATCLGYIKPFLMAANSRSLDQHQLATILDLVKRHDDCRQSWWPVLEKHISKPFSDRAKQDVLIDTGALQQLILLDLKGDVSDGPKRSKKRTGDALEQESRLDSSMSKNRSGSSTINSGKVNDGRASHTRTVSNKSRRGEKVLEVDQLSHQNGAADATSSRTRIKMEA